MRFAFWRNRYLYVAALPHAVARRKERGWPRVRSGDENPQAGRTASRLWRGKHLGRPRTLGCGAENISAGRGRSAVARKTSRQVGRGSGVSAVREPRLPRGKSVGGAPAFRPQVGRCFCGGRKTSRQVGRGSGVSAVREPRLPRGKSVGGAPAFRPQCERYGSWPDAVSAARKIWREPSPSRLRETCRRGSGPVRSSRCPPPSGDGSYSASVKAMPCSASSE